MIHMSNINKQNSGIKILTDISLYNKILLEKRVKQYYNF